ncbi:nucleotidyltransferase domain-containing protein [Thiohalorhabdus sp. Cl-TMA]|uniref:Nucleotidyltransferase domain-containing protein n=1 Tax=Thiohalorhabdus methylotrophus TaxID=3242694 RepID=A0ABV4U126_9GAMM
MRLTRRDHNIIRQTAREVFGTGIIVRVFGSRADDQARGGDLDLLVESTEAIPEKHRETLSYEAKLQQRLGDQPIDVLVLDPATEQLPIHREARRTGVAV